MLLVLFALTTQGARRASLTYDEPMYIATGYSALYTGDVRWYAVVGHPPLVNMLTAWTLLLAPNRPDPILAPEWGGQDLLGFARTLLPKLGPLEVVTFATRVPVMWMTLLLGTLVHRWATDVGGRWPGLLALGLFALNPDVIAHGQLGTTDMGLALFAFTACYALARFLRRPGWLWLVVSGLALGATLSSKASGAFFVASGGLIVVLSVLISGKSYRRTASFWLVPLAALGGLVFLVLWAAYLFEVRALPGLPIPLPAASYWGALPYISSHVSAGQPTFLAGKLYTGGQWTYFPVAILVKTPLPVLTGLALATGVSIRRGVRPPWSVLLLILVPLAYIGLAVVSGLNIGYRHLLPVLPFVFVFIVLQISNVKARIWPLKFGVWYLILGILFAWYAWGTLSVWPYTLSYFNELAGGPDNGYRYLADSSADWGQAIKELRAFVDANRVRDVKLAAFFSLDPAIYDFTFERIPPTMGAPVFLPARFNPAPGTYAISVTPLQGLWLLDPDTYDWFRRQTPIAKVGHAIFVYQVKPRDPVPTWVAQCDLGGPTLDPEQIASGFGCQDLRRLRFDCAQSWVYPAGAGWYVLPQSVERRHDPFVARRLQDARQTFEQRQTTFGPAVVVYDSAGQSTPDGSRPVAMLDGPLNYLGSKATRAARSIELETTWQATAVPTAPLSLMAHLIGADGNVLAVGDALGVPPEQWQPGDVIVQRHTLTLPENLSPGTYWVRTGAYWILGDGVHPIKVRPDKRSAVGDGVWLTPVEVTR